MVSEGKNYKDLIFSYFNRKTFNNLIKTIKKDPYFFRRAKVAI